MFWQQARCFVLLAILQVAVSEVSEVRADFNYVQAGVNGLSDRSDDYYPYSPGDPERIPIPPVPYNNYWNQGATSASASGSSGASGASASASLLVNPGIRLETHGNPDLSESTFQVASAQWRDVIRLSGSPTLPDAIRVTIAVTGNYTVDRRSDFSKNEARVFVSSQGRFQDGFTTSSPESTAYFSNVAQGFYDYYYSPNDSGFQVINARDFSYDNSTGRISWEADFSLGYSPLLGGYGMNLVFASLTRSGFDVGVIGDFGSTFRLTAVTQADGSAVSGALSFDSGFRLAAVPEPSGIVSLGSGAVALLGYDRRRRRHAKAA